MKRFLITGATGNIGMEVIHSLRRHNSTDEIIVAARNIHKAKTHFTDSPNLLFRPFDFENANTFSGAFKDIDLLFLLRPPHISNVTSRPVRQFITAGDAGEEVPAKSVFCPR